MSETLSEKLGRLIADHRKLEAERECLARQLEEARREVAYIVSEWNEVGPVYNPSVEVMESLGRVFGLAVKYGRADSG